MNTFMKKIFLVAAVFALALACTGCAAKPSYQAVVVNEQTTPGELFIVQCNEGERSSGLIVLSLPSKTDVDPTTLQPGDVLDVFGSEQITMSLPGQTRCTNIKLAGHMEGEAYEPFKTEWEYFAPRIPLPGSRGNPSSQSALS